MFCHDQQHLSVSPFQTIGDPEPLGSDADELYETDHNNLDFNEGAIPLETDSIEGSGYAARDDGAQRIAGGDEVQAVQLLVGGSATYPTSHCVKVGHIGHKGTMEYAGRCTQPQCVESLNRFRQKKSIRCFVKKVRYNNQQEEALRMENPMYVTPGQLAGRRVKHAQPIRTPSFFHGFIGTHSSSSSETLLSPTCTPTPTVNQVSSNETLVQDMDECITIFNDSTNEVGEHSNPTIHAHIQEEASISETTPSNASKRKQNPNVKQRGINECNKVANLKNEQKLLVDYYISPNSDFKKDITRHIGRLVRDRTICPVRVHKWSEIDESAKELMWQSVLSKFSDCGVELNRHLILKRMKRLWQNWRGLLKQNSIIKKGGPENALKETPNDLLPEDWKWLVTEHFTNNPEFEKVSGRNSCNRSQVKLLHRRGSQPIRQTLWDELGAKEGKDPPQISSLFKRTRQDNSGEVAAKYAEIVTIEKENPYLSQYDVLEKCFGEQNRGNVVCFASGLRPKYVRGPLSRTTLTKRLHALERENGDLRGRLDALEAEREIEKAERETAKVKQDEMERKLNMLMKASGQY